MNAVKKLILRILRLQPGNCFSEQQILDAIKELQQLEGKSSNIEIGMIAKACNALMYDNFLFSVYLGDHAPYRERLIKRYAITKKGLDYINKKHPLFVAIEPETQNDSL